MEEALLHAENKDRRTEATWKTGFIEEAKKVNRIAIPMIVVTVSQYLLRVSPIFMLGHLGELSLSSASIATSLCNVTGFSFLVSSLLIFFSCFNLLHLLFIQKASSS